MMATFMVKSKRSSSSQGLLLLSLLLLALFFAIPAPISGESVMDGGRKGKIVVKAAADIHEGDDIFNGCRPHNASATRVCCTKDHLCWPSLSECAINCPCKVRCHG